MTFQEYQDFSDTTAQYPKEQAIYYLGLGLTGEAGEVADKLKKLIRNDGGVITDEFREGIKKELGDVLWYIAQLSNEMGFTLEAVAETNVKKLQDRLNRDVVKSTGDDR